MKKAIGFEDINTFDKEKYEKFIAEVDYKNINILFNICDSANLSEISHWGLSNKYKKLLSQPLQVFMFRDKTLLFFVANCLVPPNIFFHLKWNYKNQFEEFPPSSLISIDSLNVSINSFNNVLSDSTLHYKNIYIVNWSLMLKRESKSLINEVVQHIIKHCQLDSTIIILNNIDDFFIKNGVEF